MDSFCDVLRDSAEVSHSTGERSVQDLEEATSHRHRRASFPVCARHVYVVLIPDVPGRRITVGKMDTSRTRTDRLGQGVGTGYHKIVPSCVDRTERNRFQRQEPLVVGTCCRDSSQPALGGTLRYAVEVSKLRGEQTND